MRQNLENSLLAKPRSEFLQDCSQAKVFCPDCGRAYKLKSSLRNHQKWECGKDPQFKCPYCLYKAKQKMHVTRHIERIHKLEDSCELKREIISEESKPDERAT